MLSDTEIKYLEKEIKKTISSIEQTHYQIVMGREEYGVYDEDVPGYTEYWIKLRIVDLYYLICAFLESKGLITYLQGFKNKYENIINEERDLNNEQSYGPEDKEELIIIYSFKRILRPFKFFDYRSTQEEDNKTIRDILRHTDYILKNTSAIIITEADIYKQIKWVLGLYYPSCRKISKSAFLQQFKKYESDILIPEIKTVIEYKYIKKDTQNIDDIIDQLKNDSVNYVGDPRFDNFIAVIYLENPGLATHGSIQLSWDQKKFPQNWELIIASGSKQKSKKKKAIT